jgi:HSP20 family protein
MDRLWENFFDGGQRQEFDMLEPAIEVADTKDALVVKAQVPGVSKEQIQVNVSDNTLTIKGETKKEEKKEGKNYYRQEFRYGAFARTIALPTAVQADKIEAHLKDGVLQITIPKSEQAKAKEIPIQT